MLVAGALFAVNAVLLIATASGASTNRADPLLHRRRERYSELYANEGSSTDVDSGECVYPCVCPSADPPDCPPGVVPERDACGCCLVCPRQLGQPCDVTAPCDVHRGLVCRHRHRDKVAGVCREANGLPCVVYNKTYEHGETFTLDCRTQCACQNGTYGCSSLCPQEHISPKGSCNHPRLVDVPGQCCREWMCDSQAIQQPPECQPTFTRWSHCSRECGTGISRRRSNLNAACEATTETRLCQIRRCDGLQTNPFLHDKHHHVRKGHECKATHRLSQPVRLRFGPCRSRKLFRPKYCGGCASPGVCCEPLLSTTVKVDFLCDPPPPETTGERSSDLVLEYVEPGEDMWRDDRSALWDTDGLALTVSIQWILKCRCGDACANNNNNNNNNPTSGITAQPTAASGEIILHRVHRTAAP